MDNILTFSFTEPYVERLARWILDRDPDKRGDFQRMAVVFGGKRPSLFVQRELARHLKKAFFPPQFFTIDEFIRRIVAGDEEGLPANDLDQCYTLYQLASKAAPDILKGRESFAEFLPWAREILSFIDQLDLEDAPVDALTNIQHNARIGYNVPDDINRLLQHVVVLRRAYHQVLAGRKTFSRGYRYLRAAQKIADVPFAEFDTILFCNFFYFHKTEEKIVKDLYRRKKAVLIFQGDERRWPILSRIAKAFDCPLVEGEEPKPPRFDLKLYAGFDTHSQAGTVREILKKLDRPEKAVIVLPDPDTLIPLLSEVASVVEDFNVSLGYPLKRSSTYTLLEAVFRTQLSLKNGLYYTRDYLKVLRHPLIKSLDLSLSPAATRVVVHKLEEVLTGALPTAQSGNLFIDLKTIEGIPELLEAVRETLQGMGINASAPEVAGLLRRLHDLVFRTWQSVADFSSLAAALEAVLAALVGQSALEQYPLNLKLVDEIRKIASEFRALTFTRLTFPKDEMFKIFQDRLEHAVVSFAGSPLKGMQILGLLETRSLNFDHVIVLDVNEGVLPHLQIYDPLIPREVKISLNLDRLELEEELQRYQFMRLISSAKTVHLVYQDSPDKEKSRFIEELIWEEEKKKKALGVVPVARSSFTVKATSRKSQVRKTPAMIAFLKTFRYSASSVNTYLRNPMEFYFNYCLGLREKEDLLDEPENKQIGTFVHELLEETFRRFVGRRPVIDAAFARQFTARLEEKFAATFGRGRTSDAFLMKSILDNRMQRFLEAEADTERRPVAEILYIEKTFAERIALPSGEYDFVYRVDRVDRMTDGSVMILDYKTGSVDPMPRSIGTIAAMPLSRQTIARQIRSFQMPLYFQYLDKTYPKEPINAAYYNLRTLDVSRFADRQRPEERQETISPLMRALDFVMSEIIDPQVPFMDEEIT